MTYLFELNSVAGHIYSKVQTATCVMLDRCGLCVSRGVAVPNCHRCRTFLHVHLSHPIGTQKGSHKATHPPHV